MPNTVGSSKNGMIKAAVCNVLNDHLSGIEAYGFAPFIRNHHCFSTIRSPPPWAYSLLETGLESIVLRLDGVL